MSPGCGAAWAIPAGRETFATAMGCPQRNPLMRASYQRGEYAGRSGTLIRRLRAEIYSNDISGPGPPRPFQVHDCHIRGTGDVRGATSRKGTIGSDLLSGIVLRDRLQSVSLTCLYPPEFLAFTSRAVRPRPSKVTFGTAMKCLIFNVMRAYVSHEFKEERRILIRVIVWNRRGV